MSNAPNPSEKEPSPKRPRGGQTVYNAEIAQRILDRIAEGEGLKTICRDDDMPPPSTVRLWVIDDREGFAAPYARAREAGLEKLAEEILDISDDASQDVKLDEFGKKTVDYEIVQRSKLRVDTRRWLLSKLLPKKYGDRISTQNQTLDKDGNPTDPLLPVVNVTIRHE